MQDLTVIYLTANRNPEDFAHYQRNMLALAIGNLPLISVSRKPLPWYGDNIIDTGPRSHLNMYHQLMEAAKVADTPYIAVAEDDVLYPPEHFRFYRPPLDTFAYNMSRWSLFTWGQPLFSLKQRISNCTLIAPREALIAAWEERFAKYPGGKIPKHFVSELGRHMYERQMHVKLQKTIKVYSYVPVIHINHVNGTDSRGTKKRHGELKALEIPVWGRASEVVKRYC